MFELCWLSNEVCNTLCKVILALKILKSYFNGMVTSLIPFTHHRSSEIDVRWSTFYEDDDENDNNDVTDNNDYNHKYKYEI